ncbi:hypothetical protein VQH23_23070 [Pararoseomonas sp. SCSIO 73927]|uniref:hypothetical protein n=1 Tax=Pararoseomonas sp. SCSIO 73927 TaxID=3114537 RepID=UPI0030CC844A
MLLTLLVPNLEFRDVEIADRGWVQTEGRSGEARRVLVRRESNPIRPADLSLIGSSEEETLENEVSYDLRVASVQDRVAANILLRSGFMASATARRFPLPGLPLQVEYSMEPAPAPLACASLPLSEAVQTPPQEEPAQDSTESSRPSPEELRERAAQAARLALAAVATERANRNFAQRWVELRYAALALRLTGRVPDISLGPGQIRPSTLRRLPSGMEGINPFPLPEGGSVIEALSNTCFAIRAAALIFYHFLGDPEVAGDERPGAAAAARYVGRVRRAREAGVGEAPALDYAEVVSAGADMMSAGN